MIFIAKYLSKDAICWVVQLNPFYAKVHWHSEDHYIFGASIHLNNKEVFEGRTSFHITATIVNLGLSIGVTKNAQVRNAL